METNVRTWGGQTLTNNRAFTLIELLAVIVILAIIALIAVPIILGIITDSKDSADKRSVELYLKTVEQEIVRKNLKEEFNPSTCEIKEDGNLTCNGREIEIEMKGTKPTSGILKIKDGSVNQYKLILNEKEYTNIKETPIECFEYENNGDGTATITNYLCGGTKVYNEETGEEEIISGEYMDVIVPEKVPGLINKEKNITVNREKVIQAEISEGKTEEEAQLNYIYFIMEVLFNEGYSIKKFDIEDYKIMFEANQQMEVIYDITRDESGEITFVKLNNDKCVANSMDNLNNTEEQAKEECNLYLKLESDPKTEDIQKLLEKYPEFEDMVDIEYEIIEGDVMVTAIGEKAFIKKDKSYSIQTRTMSLEPICINSIVFPETLISIGEFAFAYNRLTSLEIPSGITSIGYGAFMYNQLASVKINAPKSQVTLGNYVFDDGINIEWIVE